MKLLSAEVSRCFHSRGRPEAVALPEAMSDVQGIAVAAMRMAAAVRRNLLRFIL